jgi:hypothetical protein
MNATLQGAFVLAYFVAPGFLHYYTTRAFGVSSDADPSDAQLTIRSLCFTVILLVGEVGLLIGVALFWPDLRAELRSMVQNGPVAYSHKRPFLTLAGGTAALGANLLIAGVMGYFRIPDKWIETRLGRVGLTEGSVWRTVLNGRGASPKGSRVFKSARIRMRTGAVYAGFVAAYDLRAAKDGTRDISIWKAHYAPPGDPNKHLEPAKMVPLAQNGGGNAVILNSSEIASIEVFYVTAQ